MKNFKLLIASFVIAICTGFSSCTDEYDDSEIWKKVNELLGRVQKLEAVCEQQNSNIVALQTMLNTLKDNVYVTSVEELSEGKGYMMKFSNGESVNIYHGKQGDSPQITIVKEGDSYYWAVNGEILKDEEGNNVSADGGSSETLPKLKTGSQLVADGVVGSWENDAVYVTTDNVSWIKLNINSGSDNESIFTSVETSEDSLNVIITLNDGSTIVLPKSNKMLQMLYGTWKYIHDARIIITFNENNTYSYIFYENTIDEEIAEGSFRYIPDRYIECIGSYTIDGSYQEEQNFILTILEVTETSMTIASDYFFEGSFTRVE